jgi:DNA end-binding protein Ku
MARAIWSGTLGFGLVSIGVELHSAEAPERIDLDLLDKRDLSRIGYQKYNKKSGETVQQKDIVRGFAVAKNRYVVLSDDDIKAANPVAARTIDIVGFVDRKDIALIYFAKPYFVAPSKGSAKAYGLLEGVLDDIGQVALCRLVLRTREYVAALFPHDKALVLQMLRYDSELRTPKSLDLDLPKNVATSGAEFEMAKKLVSSMHTEWTPKSYSDTYRDDLMKLVKRRARGAKAVPETEEHHADEPRVLDLMAALRKSIDEGAKGARHATEHHARPRAVHHRKKTA